MGSEFTQDILYYVIDKEKAHMFMDIMNLFNILLHIITMEELFHLELQLIHIILRLQLSIYQH